MRDGRVRWLAFFYDRDFNRFVNMDNDAEASILDHVTPSDLYRFKNRDWHSDCRNPMVFRHRRFRHVEVLLYNDLCFDCPFGRSCGDSPYNAAGACCESYGDGCVCFERRRRCCLGN